MLINVLMVLCSCFIVCILTQFTHTIIFHTVENSWRRLNERWRFESLRFSQRLHRAESPWLQMTSAAAGVRLCVCVCVCVMAAQCVGVLTCVNVCVCCLEAETVDVNKDMMNTHTHTHTHEMIIKSVCDCL